MRRFCNERRFCDTQRFASCSRRAASILAPMVQTGALIAERYRVTRLIGAGGMGFVYEAEDTVTRRRRALKLMHPTLARTAEFRARFSREVVVSADLETEHVVEVLDAGLDPASQIPYLAMELLRGEDLSDRLHREQRLGAEQAAAILRQVARGLDAAHRKGVVHRDLKPGNVFLAHVDGGAVRVKLLDFGIAKLIASATTCATQSAGTPLYMAPEQTEESLSVSPATDLWALGLMTYHMLVGAPYWKGDSLQQLYRQILVDPLPSPVERAAEQGVTLPTGFDAWFFRLVARNPEERCAEAGAAIDELIALSGLSGANLPPIAPAPEPGEEPAPHVHSAEILDPSVFASTLPAAKLLVVDAERAPASRRFEVHDVIEKRAKEIEQIHKEIANVPFEALEHVPQLAEPVHRVKVIHDTVVSGTYNAVRNVNRLVGDIAEGVAETVAKIRRRSDVPQPPSSNAPPIASIAAETAAAPAEPEPLEEPVVGRAR